MTAQTADADELFHALDFAATRNALVELHTHLLGMGSADFWVHQIMLTYLPRSFKADGSDTNLTFDGVRNRVKEVIRWCNFGDSAPNLDSFEKESFAGFVLTDQKKSFVAEHFTADVVYSLRRLAVACGVAESEDGVDELQLSNLEATINNATGRLDFATRVKEYAIFNARKNTWQKVRGITNGDLIAYLANDPQHPAPNGGAGSGADDLRAIIRNCFELCDSNGGAAPPSHISAHYRGNFTPEFYPRRFVMKDAIYEQRLEVLAILLNNVLARYGRAGVGYVELSLSARDAANERVLATLAGCTFARHSQPATSTKSKQAPAKKSKSSATRAISARAGTRQLVRVSVAKKSAAADGGAVSSATRAAKRNREPKSPKPAKAAPPAAGPEEKLRLPVTRVRDQLKLDEVNPRWRTVLDIYNDKPKLQVFKFLMAFNRTVRPERLPVRLADPVGGVLTPVLAEADC